MVIANTTSERYELYSCRASNGIEPDDIVSVTVTPLGNSLRYLFFILLYAYFSFRKEVTIGDDSARFLTIR